MNDELKVKLVLLMTRWRMELAMLSASPHSLSLAETVKAEYAVYEQLPEHQVLTGPELVYQTTLAMIMHMRTVCANELEDALLAVLAPLPVPPVANSVKN